MTNAEVSQRYEVIWAGAHQACDLDLLCTHGVGPKRPPPPLDLHPRNVARIYREGRTTRAIRRILEGRALTAHDIADRAGLSLPVVFSSVSNLLARGVVTVVGKRESSRTFGRLGTVKVYALTEDA